MLGALIAAATLIGLSPQQKAALVVVSGLPAPAGVGGVLVQRWNVAAARPAGALAFADQEGGRVRTFASLPPSTPAAAMTSAPEAYSSGVATAAGLSRVGINVDLAPVLDLADGPLGSRQFRSPGYGVTFARGLVAGGVGACAKHFPGLGSLPVSTDVQPSVHGVLRERDLAPYREAVEAQVPCVMVGHGIYRGLGRRRAAIEPAAYELLRSLGFNGVAITDSLDVVGSRHAHAWSVQAVRAGADLVLFTSGPDAAYAMRALVPLARRGELDVHLLRVLRLRGRFG